MAKRTRAELESVDSEAIRQMAVSAKDDGWREAPEIGRQIAYRLSQAFKDADSTEDERQSAYVNLVGLAAIGARGYGVRALREGQIRVTRQGSTIRIHSDWSVPATVVENGVHESTKADLKSADVAPAERRQNLYVQFDLMSWEMFDLVWSQLQRKIDGYTAAAVTFEEIAKLRPLYPDLTVGAAIEAAGLDVDTGEIDLDALSSSTADGLAI